jgi:peptidyl-prolyl cis-trans isomerase B (cyclophilin B)
MRHLTAILLLTILLVVPAAHAQDADAAFERLQNEFGLLVRSLRNVGGMSDEDRPLVVAFGDRVTAFSARWPDHAGAVAMTLQISRWLDDTDAAAAAYERLVQLRPDDAALARSWLEEQERNGADADTILAGYAQLAGRFPDDADIRRRWIKLLIDFARYDEAIVTLERLDIDPAVDAADAADLAHCLFAAHRFEEALSLAQSVPDDAMTDPRVRARIEGTRTDAEAYVELWAAEQVLRAAEAEADDLPRVEIETARGRIVVELFENEAPNTVANFIALGSSGFYDTSAFHRVEPDFMVQGGDPNSKPGEEGTPGLGNPGYLIPDEHLLDGHRNHFGDSLAMAKGTGPNSGGCQFYLNHRPTPWLNGKHTVFGRVIEGRDVVRALRADDQILAVRVLRKRDHAYEPATLPVDAG